MGNPLKNTEKKPSNICNRRRNQHRFTSCWIIGEHFSRRFSCLLLALSTVPQMPQFPIPLTLPLPLAQPSISHRPTNCLPFSMKPESDQQSNFASSSPFVSHFFFLSFFVFSFAAPSSSFFSFSLEKRYVFFCQQVTSGCEAVWRLITNCCWETIDVNSSSSSLDTNFIIIEKSAHNEKKESQIFPSSRCRELFLWPRKKKTPANRRELHSLYFFFGDLKFLDSNSLLSSRGLVFKWIFNFFKSPAQCECQLECSSTENIRWLALRLALRNTQ